MMHRLWRYDAFALQIWCCSLHSQWWDVCPKCGKAMHHQAKPSSLAMPTSFVEGKYHWKNSFFGTSFFPELVEGCVCFASTLLDGKHLRTFCWKTVATDCFSLRKSPLGLQIPSNNKNRTAFLCTIFIGAGGGIWTLGLLITNQQV